MNETVTIKEGGLTRRLAPIDKLKVNTTDNKDSTWVSAGNANTGVLHASENGIYIASEDGYEAYSEVIVRVTKDSFEGDTSFDDWDYETPDMDLSNWDPETIEDFELDPDGFDDVFNNEDEWKDIDKPIDIKMDNPKIQDTKISGIDPVTGNEMEVGLDENGYLTESTLPSSIKIVQLPSKLKYKEGEKILFNLVVKAYTEDGNIWTGESDIGVIKTRNLIFPITVAISGGSTSYKIPDTNPFELPSFGYINVGNNVTIVATWWYDGEEHENAEYASETPMLCATYIDNQTEEKYLLASTTRIDAVETSGTIFIGSYDYGGKTVYYAMPNAWTSQIIGISPTASPTFPWQGNEKMKQAAWQMVYGENEIIGVSIPVQYIRSDGEVLEDSFTIEVLPDPDGAHPQVDPSTVEWNHRRYKANEDLGAVEVRHGSVYMEGGAIYDVGAAVRLGMLEPVDNEIVP